MFTDTLWCILTAFHQIDNYSEQCGGLEASTFNSQKSALTFDSPKTSVVPHPLVFADFFQGLCGYQKYTYAQVLYVKWHITMYTVSTPHPRSANLGCETLMTVLIEKKSVYK